MNGSREDNEIKELEYQGLLYDFYGELLTEKQKMAYGDHVLDDFSLTEIAQSTGVSRQAAHDLIKRTDSILKGYEAKLHLVERFLKVKEQVLKIQEIVDETEEDSAIIGRINELTTEILNEL